MYVEFLFFIKCSFHCDKLDDRLIEIWIDGLQLAWKYFSVIVCFQLFVL